MFLCHFHVVLFVLFCDLLGAICTIVLYFSGERKPCPIAGCKARVFQLSVHLKTKTHKDLDPEEREEICYTQAKRRETNPNTKTRKCPYKKCRNVPPFASLSQHFRLKHKLRRTDETYSKYIRNVSDECINSRRKANYTSYAEKLLDDIIDSRNGDSATCSTAEKDDPTAFHTVVTQRQCSIASPRLSLNEILANTEPKSSAGRPAFDDDERNEVKRIFSHIIAKGEIPPLKIISAILTLPEFKDSIIANARPIQLRSCIQGIINKNKRHQKMRKIK